MADIKLIVDVDGTEQVVSLNDALEGTSPAAKKAGDALAKANNDAKKFNNSTGGVRKNTNRMNAVIQNAGFQVGDLAVQLQGGQNALVAFSQQGAQLAGLLPGVYGAIAGISLVIGMQFLKSTGLANGVLERMANLFLSAKGAAEKFKDELAEATSFTERYRRSLDSSSLAQQALFRVLSEQKGTDSLSVLSTAFNKLEVDAVSARRRVLSLNRALQDTRSAGASLPEGSVSRQVNLQAIDEATRRLEEAKADFAVLGQVFPEFQQIKNVDIKDQVSLNKAILAGSKILGELRGQALEVLGSEEKLEAVEAVVLGLSDTLDSLVKEEEAALKQATDQLRAAEASFYGATSITTEQDKLLVQAHELVDALRERLVLDGEISEADALYMEQYRSHLEERIQGYFAEKKAAEELEKQKKAVETQSNKMATSITNGFRDIIGGTKTAAEAFRDMALKIIDQILDIMIYQPMIKNISNALMGPMGGFMGYSPGGGTYGGAGGILSSILPFANGGVVNGPTYFGHSGGLGLMGEAGPEAILPLQRGPGGKLGVAGGGGVNITQNFNFSANGDESVKRIIAAEAPKMAKFAAAEVVKSRQKGGAMRSTFG